MSGHETKEIMGCRPYKPLDPEHKRGMLYMHVCSIGGS